MRVRGHTVRIVGTLLLALGILLVVAGLVAGAIAALWVKDVADSGQRPSGDSKDLFQGLVLGAIAAGAAGVLVLALGIVLRGVGKALNERAQRIDASATASN